MIEFTLFGVPVRIHPSHWLGLAILGGILYVRAPEDIYPVLLFMVAGFVSILSHEMGHALVGRKLGRAATSVDLVVLGGYTQYYGSQFKKHGKSISILAGPTATLLLGVVSWFVLVVLLGDLSIGTIVALKTALSPFWALQLGSGTLLTQSELMFAYFLGCFMFISVWWTILNMLPIMPLDGGQFLAEYIRSPRKLYLIGTITATAILVFALIISSTLLSLFMAFMAIENFKAMKQAPF